MRALTQLCLITKRSHILSVESPIPGVTMCRNLGNVSSQKHTPLHRLIPSIPTSIASIRELVMSVMARPYNPVLSFLTRLATVSQTIRGSKVVQSCGRESCIAPVAHCIPDPRSALGLTKLQLLETYNCVEVITLSAAPRPPAPYPFFTEDLADTENIL